MAFLYHFAPTVANAPSWPRSRVLELAPVRWRQTVARPDVQQRLDVNIYRRATLAPARSLSGAR
jgi:hypothetical protein